MFANNFPMQKLVQQRRQANVAFFKKQRIVMRKLRAARPNIPPEIWKLIQQNSRDLFMQTWDAKVEALEKKLS
jgi:hypothetical protein